ncbi:MAG: outer membrane protein transport protein [Thermoanaerobaculales bacterium]|nr:outer membrane protein transport protein [Thermoanaerobaculales bacterium]
MGERRVIILVFFLVAVPAVNAHAQSDAYAFTGINFNFTNPGARARGIGGAFVAIADDSTAALANPAGLAYLGREASMEWIQDEEEYPVGQLTHDGVSTSIEGTRISLTGESDPYRVTAQSTSNRVNFGSVLLPLIRNKLTLAMYYGVLADLDAGFLVGDGVVCVEADGTANLPGGGEECTLDLLNPDGSQVFSRYFGQTATYSISTKALGTGIGYRIGDYWSLGLSLALGQTRVNARSLIDLSSVASAEDRLELSSGDDEDLMYGAGILYRSDRWGFGLSWRSNSRYELTNSLMTEDGQVIDDRSFPGRFTVPERTSAGLAFFPGDNWVIATEITRISYSDVLSQMDPFDRTIEEAGIQYRIKDVTELHLGLEYTTFSERRGWSIRGGWWRDMTHLPFVNESYSDPRNVEYDLVRAEQSLVRAPFEEDIDHFTVGIGLSSGVVRLDAAADWTDKSGVDFLVSGVWYF